ncbi:hypothetical protein JCM5350_001986 [Sporobolomyces pararoseus]
MPIKSNASSTTLTRSLPVALKLPEETWIQILLEIKDYAQLKRAGRICKKFQRIIKGSEFEVLFRSRPQTGALASNRQVILHPLIEKTDGCFPILDLARVDVLPDHPGYYYATDFPTILEEFATFPTLTTITFSFPEGPAPVEPLVKISGITVKDFLLHVAEYWSTEADDTLVNQDRRFRSFTPWKSVMTYYNAMGDYSWIKWKCVVKGNGDVEVTGRHFRSGGFRIEVQRQEEVSR